MVQFKHPICFILFQKLDKAMKPNLNETDKPTWKDKKFTPCMTREVNLPLVLFNMWHVLILPYNFSSFYTVL